jgi:hypothetical protein
VLEKYGRSVGWHGKAGVIWWVWVWQGRTLGLSVLVGFLLERVHDKVFKEIEEMAEA